MFQDKSKRTGTEKDKNSYVKFEIGSSNEKKPTSNKKFKLVISRSLFLFLLLLIFSFLIALGFHIVPKLVQDLSFLCDTSRSLFLRFDTRLSSLLGQDSKDHRFRKVSYSVEKYGKPYFSDDSLRDSPSVLRNRKLFAVKEVETDLTSSDVGINNYSPLSGKLLPYSSGSTAINSMRYSCHRFVVNNTTLHNHKDIELDSDNCFVHEIFSQLPESLNNKLDLPELNAINSLNGTFLAIKKIISILENKSENEGLLIILASNMNYEKNWRLSLNDLYSNWEAQTHVSQIITTSWVISKSFFVGKHLVPALDYNFLILNIPPERNNVLSYSNELSHDLLVSLNTVKMFVSNFSLILENGISKILSGLNMDFLTENKLTEDLFNGNDKTLSSYKSLNKYFNGKQSLKIDHFLSSLALDLSRLVEETPTTIVDSTNLHTNKLEYKYKNNTSGIYLTDLTKTQIVVLSIVERKKIARYSYEERFRRICVYQAHTEINSILRSTASRASVVEYARYHGYSYFLFDGSFYDAIPRVLFTDWSKQGYYVKLFSGLRLLFWNLDRIGRFLGKYINNFSSNLMKEEVYTDFLDYVIPDDINFDWDKEHDAKIGSAGQIKKGGVSGSKGIQVTPSNIEANICDYIAWFDLDVAITNKYYSIEKMLESHISEGKVKMNNTKHKNVIMDASEIAMFISRDSEWQARHSIANSGFIIFGRSRHTLQTIFHSIALSPVKSQEVVKNGRFWPEQSTLSHSLVYIYNESFSTPENEFHFSDTISQTVNRIITQIIGPAPIMFYSFLNETKIGSYSLVVSQRLLNGFLHIRPDSYGEGPWYPGDWFIHAAGHRSPFRDNVLSGILFSINTLGYEPGAIDYYKRNCFLSLDFVHKGLDRLIAHLTQEFEQFELIKDQNPDMNSGNITNVDLAFNFVMRLMAVKTRHYVDFNNDTDRLHYEKIHFLKCDYELPLFKRWSIAEATALGAACFLGVFAFIAVSLILRHYSNKK